MRCNATVDENHPLLQGVPEPPMCPAHGPRRLAVDMREYSRGWVCCRGSPPQVLPCPGQRLPLPDVPAAAPQAAPTPAAAPLADAAWFNQGPPDTLALQRTHSWLFVPLLHAAVGRLHPAALARWEAHPLYSLLWQRNLALLRQAPPVEPQALVHALHTLQQLASEEGRALPAPEAQLLLALAAESNRLPSNTLVHLPWAWRFAALPDGYIPASAQEALLHAYLGERAAAALLQEVTASHQNRLPAPAPAAPPHPPAANTPPAQIRPAPARGRSASSSSSSTSSSTSSTPNRRPSEEPPAQPATASHQPGNADTQPSPAPADQLHGPRLQAALASLDPFDAEDVLLQPCSLFRSPPPFCKPQLRRALKLSLKLVRDASTADAPDAPQSLAATRAWKLFLFLPRLLLFRPAGALRVPKPELLARFSAFERGEWSALLHQALAEAAAVGLSPAGSTDTVDRRAQRATRLARLGELSAARQALTSEPLAPANAETLTALTDPLRRPQQPYGEMPETVTSFVPEVPVALDRAALLSNLRRARKAAAPGPSGYTAEIIRLVLDDEETATLLCDVSCLLARARLPEPAVAALSIGRLVAIRKPSGGTRGLVVGDFLRRLVARTLAQQFASHFQAACSPHQYALSSRAGAEALVHTLQARTQADTHLTVVSVDATAAYDLVSREAMLTAVRDLPALSPLLPFARLWYARESVYLWCAGEHSHRISQSEGGEQGDPLMPALFSVALAPALHDLQRELRPSEQVLAYLDDVYILASPDRVALLYRRLEELIWQRARLRLNASKTRVWNAAGVLPDAVPQLAPDSAVWVGDPALSPEQRGLVALGVPIGSAAFIESHLQQSLARHAGLLQTLPAIHDTQISWLLLSCCAAPRAQYALRSLPPEATRAFATAHDDAVLACLDTLLSSGAPSGLPLLATARAQLALRHGGLGLRSAARHAPAAYWSSWADVLPVIASRDPAFARALADTLEGGSPAPEVLQSLLLARASLTASTSSATAPSFVSMIPPLPLCWTRRQAPSLRESSRPGLPPLHGNLRTSECCCCGASGSLCR